MVVTTQRTKNIDDLVRSMKNPTLYELFVWMHHFAAKDSELTTGTLRDTARIDRLYLAETI